MQNTDLLHFIDGLYGYAMAITRNRNDAEDLVQQTCVRAFRRMGSLRAGSNVKSWLFTLLKDIHRNQLRNHRTAPRVLAMDAARSTAAALIETSRDSLASCVSKTERERLIEAVHQLPSEFREIVVLRESEGMSYQEIAAILDCPVGTVMSRLARARSRLRTLLVDKGQSMWLEQSKDRRNGFA